MFSKLPIEIIDTIYEYEGTYKKNMDIVVDDINTKYNWYSILTNTMLESFIYAPLSLYPEQYDIPSFYRFFFERFSTI